MHALVDETGRAGALVKVTCESAPAARQAAFTTFVHQLAHHALVRVPRDLTELAQQDWSFGGTTVAAALEAVSGQVGESIAVTGLARFDCAKGLVYSYVTQDGRQAVLLAMHTEASRAAAREVLRSLAGQVLVQRIGGIVATEEGLQEVFDPLELSDRPWSRDPSRTVQAVLEETLGAGSHVEAFAAFRVER